MSEQQIIELIDVARAVIELLFDKRRPFYVQKAAGVLYEELEHLLREICEAEEREATQGARGKQSPLASRPLKRRPRR